MTAGKHPAPAHDHEITGAAPRRCGRAARIGRALLARAMMGGWALLPLQPVLAALLSWLVGVR